MNGKMGDEICALEIQKNLNYHCHLSEYVKFIHSFM